MRNDEKNLELLDLVIRTVRITDNKVPYKNNAYTLILERGDIVECNFTGIGKELNLVHFGIVWSAKADNENINIIPLTSKVKDEGIEQFNIGTVSNFYTKDEVTNTLVNKESFVYLQKLMEVSRKRIKPKYEQDDKGNILKHQKDSKTIFNQLKINDEQINRIKEGIQLFYSESGDYLVSILEKIHIKYQLLIDETDDAIFDVGYRKIQSHSIYNNILDSKIILKCHINNKLYSAVLKKIQTKEELKYSTAEHKALYKKHIVKWENKIDKVRNKIIDALFSRNKEKVDNAKQILRDLFI